MNNNYKVVNKSVMTDHSEQISHYKNATNKWDLYGTDNDNYDCPIGFRKGRKDTFLSKVIAIEPFYVLEVGGIKKLVPLELESLNQIIIKSKNLSDLPEDWDTFGALQINVKTWEKMSHFLIDYSLYVFNNYNATIQMPAINPCPNGSIDLVWRTKKVRLLVNIKPYNSKIIGSYYGDLFENKQAIKHIIETDAIVEHFAFWMKNLT